MAPGFVLTVPKIGQLLALKINELLFTSHKTQVLIKPTMCIGRSLEFYAGYIPFKRPLPMKCCFENVFDITCIWHPIFQILTLVQKRLLPRKKENLKVRN